MREVDTSFPGDRLTLAIPRGPRKPRDGMPNVIVFFTDQQRWDTSGLHGNPMGLTPNLDLAARLGTHLVNSFTVQPVCGPARACLQTGRYATQNGCFVNGIALRPDDRTLAHHFADAGYRTGYIGKWHLADHEPVPAEERGGYEFWLAANKLEFTSDTYHTVVFDGDRRAVRLPGYRVDALTDAAIRYVDEHQDEPFFLMLSHLEPHHQNHLDDHPPPNGYRERYTGGWVPPDLAQFGGSSQRQLGGYYGQVKRLDEAYGRLMDALQSLGLDGNTIVLFTSDHGNHFRTRNAEYKRSGHDAALRVPTVLRGCGFEGGRRVEELTTILDLGASLLDAAGIAVPDEMEGRSVLQLMRGERASWRDEVLFQISESEVGRGIRTRRWKYGVMAPDADPKRDAAADRYVESYLYDLDSDPYELFDLVGQESHLTVADRLRERLRARLAEIGEAPVEIVPAPTRKRVGQREVFAGDLPS